MKRGSDFDRIFFVTIVAILLFGLVMLYSACQSEDEARRLDAWKRQGVFAAVGLVAFALGAAVPHDLWNRTAPFVYAATIGLLIAVLAVGASGGGATRWLSFGGVRLQPSELAKIGTVLLLAWVLSRRRRPPESLWGLMQPLAVVLPPLVLTFLQPDLGTAVVFLVAIPPMLFWSGVSVPYLVLASTPLLSIVCASHPVAWLVFAALLLVLIYRSRARLSERIIFATASVATFFLTKRIWGTLEPYQQQRLRTFLNPAQDETGAGYQIIQSTVAVGSGGITGAGYLEGTQKGLEFLPARHTDFIFSVLGEELGFLGTMALLVLYALLLVRGLRIAAAVRDSFASLTVVGILSILAFQVFVNIGVNLGLVPVTGLPLPIFSYGGTSLVSTLGGLGIIMGIFLRRRRT